MTLLDAALGYATIGWAVFPLQPRDKRPYPGSHGCKDASVDPAQVRAWWGLSPQSNVGIATGVKSDLVVVDVDGEDGSARLLELQHDAGQAIPPTRWVRTGTGGWHAYFRHPGGLVPNTASRIAAHVDSRGEGGFVVAPPSVHPCGEQYVVATALDPAPLPGWLLERMRPPAPPPMPAHVLRAGTSRYAAAALEAEAAAVARCPEGGRNHRLNVAAFSLGQLVGAGALDENTVHVVLHDAARSAGLGEGEALATIASGFRAGRANPRRLAS
jgi:hypothetical protein